MNDNELLDLYIAGDTRAFEKFYSRHKNSLYTYIFNRIPGKAEDLFQDSFYQFVNALSDRVITNPVGYLYKIALNNIRKQFRKKQEDVLVFNPEIHVEEDNNESRDYDENELKSGLISLAAEKPDFYDVLHLHIYENMTFDQISEFRNENRNTVASRFRYALAFLRKYIDKERSCLNKRGIK